MTELCRVRIRGPLEAHLEQVWSGLLALAYTPLSARSLMRLMAHLSRWMEAIGLRTSGLTEGRIEEFLEERRQSFSNHLTRQGLEPILEQLRRAGVVAVLEKLEPTANEQEGFLVDYAEYLVRERAVVPVTVRHYRSIARSFLSHCFGEEDLELSRLGASDVTSFVLRQCRASNVGRAKYTVTALRSFLRYLFLRGELANNLVGAVAGIADWRQASLPKALPVQQVHRLLRSCDRRTHMGQRNYAILLLLARFGLRAGEVAALELDDFHWRQGEVVIRGKGLREDRLPLPGDVGEAVVAYLRRARPQTSSRKLFLSITAPRRGLTGCAVSKIVRRACIHAGLEPVGSHRLRHTAATQMLHKGAALSEVAQLLRHRSVNTTALYAKVDRQRLRELAQPWPGGVA